MLASCRPERAAQAASRPSWPTRIPRIPELAIFAIVQSIIFVLLFAFVFGGAIPLPDGGNYREYLMPGIFPSARRAYRLASPLRVARGRDCHRSATRRL